MIARFIARSIAAMVAVAYLSASALARSEAEAIRTVNAMAWDVFCIKLGSAARLPVGKDEDYRAAMLRRAEKAESITTAHITAIKKRELLLGMGLCAVAAAFGRPARVNRTVGRFGEHYQIVYANPRRYIYLENGLVTSWQD